MPKLFNNNQNPVFMKSKLYYKNPFLLFLPFLLLFMAYILKLHSNNLQGDESRYIFFVKNMIQGFYSPKAPDINLTNGPCYPLIILPFYALNTSKLFIALMNALFQYLSIVFLFKALRQIVPFYLSLSFTLFWAFCFSSYNYMILIYTEPLTALLISLIAFFVIKGYKSSEAKNYYIAGLLFGYLALTKVIFGYVIAIMLLAILLLWFKNLKAIRARNGAIMMIIAFAVTLPYLVYTYSLTGRIFYWGSAGNDSLYWMSTPYEYEYGTWNNLAFDANPEGPEKDLGIKLLTENHAKDFESIKELKGIEYDEALKKIALSNIKSHPVKYIKNWFSNISRMLFGFPGNYTFEVPLLKIWYFSIVYTLIIYAGIMTIFTWKNLPYSIRLLFCLSFIYLGGSSLVSADNRQFVIILPALYVWIAYILQQTIKINFKPDQAGSGSEKQ
jgi:4-amino-4-deoxy-L-arabinose transferase-like glycosyltransferase